MTLTVAFVAAVPRTLLSSNSSHIVIAPAQIPQLVVGTLVMFEPTVVVFPLDGATSTLVTTQ